MGTSHLQLSHCIVSVQTNALDQDVLEGNFLFCILIVSTNSSFTSQDAENRRTVEVESERLRYARAAALNAEILAQSNRNVPCVMKNVKPQTLKNGF